MDKKHYRRIKQDNLGSLCAVLAWSVFEHCAEGLDLVAINTEATWGDRKIAQRIQGDKEHNPRTEGRDRENEHTAY